MEPARVTLAIVRPLLPETWSRLEAELEEQGSPPLTFAREDGRVVFEGRTAEFMVRARVFDALDRTCGHGEWQRAFRPVDEDAAG